MVLAVWINNVIRPVISNVCSDPRRNGHHHLTLCTLHYVCRNIDAILWLHTKTISTKSIRSAFLPSVGALWDFNRRFNSGIFNIVGSFPFRAAPGILFSVEENNIPGVVAVLVGNRHLYVAERAGVFVLNRNNTSFSCRSLESNDGSTWRHRRSLCWKDRKV